VSDVLAPVAAPRGVGIDVRALVADYGAAPVLRGIDLTIAGGEILALLGPSGCGKTTLLRCIAGLERPRSGSIHIGDREVTAGKGVPAERRRVGMVFQDGALFPHRTVVNNVNYGIVRGPARDQRANEALRLVGLADKRDRMPGTLSGGEQQRVALARALAPKPGVVLLDEPFASLDAALRVQLRDEVRRLLTDVGVTAILVTHDQEEAMSFGDRVAVMHGGLVEQVGTPEEIYATPASPRIARFVGEAVVLPALLNGTTADTALGVIAVRPTPVSAGNVSTGTVMLRPEQISALPGGDAIVTAVHYFGAETRYEILVPALSSPVVVRSAGSPRHRVHDKVTVTVADTVVHAWSNGDDDDSAPAEETTNVATMPCA
jgi:iron(III) transport system ATP-binding protein